MASVILDHLWVHDATSPADFVRLDLDGERERSGVELEVRRYANGRRRTVRRPGRDQALSVTCEQVARADTDRLRELAGRLVLVREPRGRRFWGVFAGLDVDEVFGVDYPTLSITFREVSHQEAV